MVKPRQLPACKSACLQETHQCLIPKVAGSHPITQLLKPSKEPPLSASYKTPRKLLSPAIALTKLHSAAPPHISFQCQVGGPAQNPHKEASEGTNLYTGEGAHAPKASPRNIQQNPYAVTPSRTAAQGELASTTQQRHCPANRCCCSARAAGLQVSTLRKVTQNTGTAAANMALWKKNSPPNTRTHAGLRRSTWELTNSMWGVHTGCRTRICASSPQSPAQPPHVLYRAALDSGHLVLAHTTHAHTTTQHTPDPAHPTQLGPTLCLRPAVQSCTR